MKKEIEEISVKPTVNYWKISTLFLLLTLIIFGIFTSSLLNKQKSLPSDSNQPTTVVIVPTNTSIPQVTEKNHKYPSNAFWLTKGNASISVEDIYETKYFVLSLKPYSQGQGTSTSSNQEKSYKIPLLNMDYVTDPKISHNEKFGCVTIGASGYSGYYIFTLPEGNQIDQGKQYSHCIEWIDDHQVIIAENIYNTHDYSYYIFDAKTKSKNVLSTFSQQ